MVLNMQNLELFTLKLPYVRCGTRADGDLGYFDENKLRIGVSNWAFLMEYFLQAS